MRSQIKINQMTNWMNHVLEPGSGVSVEDRTKIVMIFSDAFNQIEPIYDKYHNVQEHPQGNEAAALLAAMILGMMKQAGADPPKGDDDGEDRTT